MILALARHIFEHGVDGRFYSNVRKYHHEGGRSTGRWTRRRRRPASSTVARRPDYEARLAAGTLPKR